MISVEKVLTDMNQHEIIPKLQNNNDDDERIMKHLSSGMASQNSEQNRNYQ